MTPKPNLVSHEEIAALAHSYWQAEGHPEGRAEIHWQRAQEALLKTKPAEAKAAVSVSRAKTGPKKSARAKT